MLYSTNRCRLLTLLPYSIVVNYFLDISSLSDLIFLERLIGVLSDLDRDSLARARELITNSVMSEIQHEDPHGQSSFENAVRHQIVASCQRIRILLLVTDQLMAMYNDAITSGKTTPGRF